MQTITIWDKVAVVSSLGVWFCGGEGGRGRALNMLNNNRELFEVSSPTV